MNEIREQKRLILRKHVNAIHCTGYSRLLTGKIANVLLFNAYNDLPTTDTYEIGIKEFCELINFHSRDYKAIRGALLELITTPVEWAILSADDIKSSEWRGTSLLGDAILKDATLTYSYSPTMRKLLHKPEIYGQIDINTVSKFSSVYGLNLYENCIRFKNLDATPWMHLSIFKKLMGIKSDEYIIFRDFNRRVLKKAIEEVCTVSPIHVKPEFKKINRNISEIRFLISKNNKLGFVNCQDTEWNEKDFSSSSIIPTETEIIEEEGRAEVISLLEAFNFNNKRIAEVLAKYDDNYILEKIQLIKNSNDFKTGKIQKIGGLLYAALRDNYEVSVSSADVIRQQEREKRIKYEKEQYAIKKLEQKKQDYQKYIDDIARADLQKLDKVTYQQKIGDYLAILRDDTNAFSSQLLKFYNAHGMSSSIFFHSFKKYCLEEIPEIFSKVPTFEEYSRDLKGGDKQ